MIKTIKDTFYKWIFLSVLTLCFNQAGQGQTTVFTDDFSSNTNASWTTSGSIGSSSWSVTRSGDDWGARRNTSPEQLEQTNDVGATANVLGWVYSSVALSSFSTPFNSTLSSNPGLITWTFNFRTNRASALAGFTATNSYGMAMILVSASNLPNTSGSGYAVVMGGGGSNSIALISFNNGLQGTRITIIGFGNAPTALNDYLSVKVTYNPTGDNWELYSRDDGSTGFADPASGTLIQIGTTTSNNTYTGTSMSYLGTYWQGSTIASQTTFFDNVKVTVVPASSPSISVGTIPGFGNQTVNTTSSEKSYAVSGSNLTNNIIITPPSNFEISLTSGSGFVANPGTITLTQSGGSVPSTTIYVRFKPIAVTGYTGNITHSSAGASAQNVAVSGTGTAPADPTGVSATTISNAEIDIAFTKNGSNNVLIAWNSTNTFGTPTGSYSAGNPVSGGGTVLYAGGSSPVAHLSLTSNTAYYYKVWTVDALNFYSAGVEVNAITFPDKPSNHATGLTASSPSPAYNALDISWTDAPGTTIPDGYVIKASTVGYGSITAPVDGTPETAGTLIKIAGPIVQIAGFTSLSANTVYYFKIFPFTNSGAAIDYKTDGSPPQVSVTTTGAPEGPKVFFSEYLEGSSNNKALEIYNAGNTALDLSKLVVKLYANGAVSPTNTWTGTTGTLAVNAVYVLYNSGSSAPVIASGNASASVCNYNGNDALELIYDGVIKDVFGIAGTDPGTSWTIAGNANATVDKTLVRKLNVTDGTTNWVASAGTDAGSSQWVVLSLDYSGNLGGFGTAWTGASGTAWATAANWDMDVPSGTVNAIIPDVTNDPEISTTVAVKNLLIKASGKLSVSGTLTTNGIVTILKAPD